MLMLGVRVMARLGVRPTFHMDSWLRDGRVMVRVVVMVRVAVMLAVRVRIRVRVMVAVRVRVMVRLGFRLTLQLHPDPVYG